MTIQQVQDEIIEEFELFDNQNDKYNYIIEMGKKLPALNEAYKLDENLIKGCQSKVWLHTEWEEGKIQYCADSDALIVRGLVSLMVRVLSNRTPQEIMEADLYFVKKIGLDQMLSMTRSNGLSSMIKQMKFYALAYQSR
jgi:cysteine desulfuration protein SufE